MARLFNLFRRRRDRLERDLDRELQYHVDRRISELTRAGVNEADARRQVSIELGGVTQVQEAVRDAWIHQWLDAFVRDVRYAMRSLRRGWGFTLGAGRPRPGHRRQRRHFLGGQYRLASAAPVS